MFLFTEINDLAVNGRLTGALRDRAEAIICERHYTKSVPSGKSRYYRLDGAIVVYSIPANNNIASFLLGREGCVWELTRLWAPDGHERNLLTRAISASVDWFRGDEPAVEALVSYADPNVNHEGGVYRAASWLYTGQSEESRYYVGPDGTSAARRKFHSGSKGMTKAEIEGQGYTQQTRPGKHRYARGLTRRARRDLLARWGATTPLSAESARREPEPTAAADCDSLEEIAAKVNAAHEARGGHVKHSLERACEAGLLLVEARKRFPYQRGGEGWLGWLKANVRFPERTVHHYMRIARNWDRLESKSAMIADLGVVEAVRLISQPNDSPQQDEATDDTSAVVEPECSPVFRRLVDTWRAADEAQRRAFLAWVERQRES